MKFLNIKYFLAVALVASAFTGCSLDDDAPMTSDDDGMVAVDFSGSFSQVDHMGRPGINTVLSGSASIKNMHNTTVPSNMQGAFQQSFQERLEALHDAYAVALGLTAEDVDYEPNILGDILNGPEPTSENNPNIVSAEVLTTVLSNDVLEVAPDFPTTYFNPGAGAPTFDGAIGLTGRAPQDDVIDISLILLFGGETGARFNGQNGLPVLVTDGVSFTADANASFPYLSNPE